MASPPFGRIDSDGMAWIVRYDEETLEVRSETRTAPDQALGLPSDGLSGAGAVEIVLSKLLCP